ncbi:hypothetical protein ABPG75_012692 [Micractinium tetrahymenae]
MPPPSTSRDMRPHRGLLHRATLATCTSTLALVNRCDSAALLDLLLSTLLVVQSPSAPLPLPQRLQALFAHAAAWGLHRALVVLVLALVATLWNIVPDLPSMMQVYLGCCSLSRILAAVLPASWWWAAQTAPHALLVCSGQHALGWRRLSLRAAHNNNGSASGGRRGTAGRSADSGNSTSSDFNESACILYSVCYYLPMAHFTASAVGGGLRSFWALCRFTWGLLLGAASAQQLDTSAFLPTLSSSLVLAMAMERWAWQAMADYMAVRTGLADVARLQALLPQEAAGCWALHSLRRVLQGAVSKLSGCSLGDVLGQPPYTTPFGMRLVLALTELLAPHPEEEDTNRERYESLGMMRPSSSKPAYAVALALVAPMLLLEVTVFCLWRWFLLAAVHCITAPLLLVWNQSFRKPAAIQLLPVPPSHLCRQSAVQRRRLHAPSGEPLAAYSDRRRRSRHRNTPALKCSRHMKILALRRSLLRTAPRPPASPAHSPQQQQGLLLLAPCPQSGAALPAAPARAGRAASCASAPAACRCIIAQTRASQTIGMRTKDSAASGRQLQHDRKKLAEMPAIQM